MEPKTLAEIKEFRKEIEADLVEMLEETGSDFTLDDIKDTIFNEEESDDMQKVIAMFDNGNPSNLSNVLELVSDAWNHFPHKILGGIPPAEKLLKYNKKNPSKTKKFHEAYNQFLMSKDPSLHSKAIKILLEEIGLDKEYVRMYSEKNEIKNFFLLWEYAGKVEKNRQERKGLKKMGELSKKFYESKEYANLCDLFFNIVFRHLVDFAKLKELRDFEEITDHDLYKKGLIPSEIFLQYFIVETFAKKKNFDWNRGDEIANQNLACFIVCWCDVYDFFHENE